MKQLIHDLKQIIERGERNVGRVYISAEQAKTLVGMLEPQSEPVGEIVPKFDGPTVVQLFNSDLPVGAKLYAAPQPQVVSGLALAAIGVKHFGNPIPAEWYAAAKELLAAPQPQADDANMQAWSDGYDAAMREFETPAPQPQAEPVQFQLRDRPPGAARPWSKWHAYDSRAERDHDAEDCKKHGWQVETRDLYAAPQPQADLRGLVAQSLAAACWRGQPFHSDYEVADAILDKLAPYLAAPPRPQAAVVLEELGGIPRKAPQPQASAEDVALVERSLADYKRICLREYGSDVSDAVDAFERIRASLGVGK